MITSATNDRVRRVRLLQSKRRARQKEKCFVIEGNYLLQEAIRAEVQIEEVFYTQAYADSIEGKQLLSAASQSAALLLEVSDDVLQAMSDTVTPQGIIGVLPSDFPEPPRTTSVSLIIDSISDPGNLGTIMRTAVAAGVHEMIMTSGSVDLTNPKVVRSAMGAHFHLPTRYSSWEGIARQFEEKVIFLAESRGGAAYYDIDWTQPCALIVSDEAHGPTSLARSVAHVFVTIPMTSGAESLNVAVASGILLFEIARQRVQTASEFH